MLKVIWLYLNVHYVDYAILSYFDKLYNGVSIAL
jgi:hypothetical protein